MIRCKHPLTRYREAKGIGQAALARLLGVTPAAISRWESGARQPEPATALKIARKTGIPPSELRPDLAEFAAEAS